VNIGAQGPAAARQVATPAMALGAALLGAVYAVSAWSVSPFVLPALLVGVGLVVVTVQRPEVGVAAAFLLVPLSNLGLTGKPPWLITSLWALFLCVLGLWRYWGEWPRLTGPLLFNLLVALVAFIAGGAVTNGRPEVRATIVGLLYFFGLALLIRTRRQVMWALGGITAAIVLVGLLTLRERLSGAPTSVAFFTANGELVGRVAAGFGQPNELGGFLVLLIPFAVAGALLPSRLRIVHVAAVLLGVFGIYASFSRGALIALVAVPFVFMRGRRLLWLAPLLVAVTLLATPGLVKERFATLTQSGSEIATRVDFWTTAVNIWESHPILGVGVGQFPNAYAAARVPGRGFLPDSFGEPPPHAHNLFLQALATEGLIGLVALLAILGSAAAAAISLRRRGGQTAAVLGGAFLASLVALLIHNQFDVTLLEGTGMYFWALLGLLAACFAHLEPEAAGAAE
jgi:O-antigen ligase